MNLEEKQWPQWESDGNVEKSKKDTVFSMYPELRHVQGRLMQR